MELKNYYKKEELWLPTYPQFRVFKFVLPHRKQVIRLYIRSIKDLRKYLLHYQPLSAYYSVSTFLNPKTARGIDEKQLSKRLVMLSDIPFDIDAHEGDFDKAKKDTIKLINEMDKLGYERKYIAFSGGGFHVVYKSNVPRIANPKDRERNLKSERLELISHIKSKNISIDTDITKDINRVLRIPYTVNIKRGQIAKIIDYTNLLDFQLPKRLDVYDQNTHFKKKGEKRDLGITSSPKYFISNDLYGMNRFVLFLKYSLPLHKVKIDLKKLQKLYNLSDIYIFKRERWFYAVCLQTFQKERLNKIVKASYADNSQIKFSQTWLRIPFYYVETLESKRKDIYVSKGHLLMLKKIFPKIKEYPNTHGREKIGVINGLR